MSEQQQPQQLQIKASDEKLAGVYANMANVGHGGSGEEFVLDFLSVFPPGGQLVSRVMLSPSHLKRLSNAMQEQLKQYEEKFGTISLAVVPDHKIGFRTE